MAKNKAFYFASVERQDADDSRAVTIDETTLVAESARAGCPGHARIDPARRRFRVRDRRGSVPRRDDAGVRAGRREHCVGAAAHGARQYRRRAQRKHRAVRRDHGEEPRRRTRQPRLDDRGDARGDADAARLQRSAGRRSRAGIRSSARWIPQCGGPCTSDTDGGPQVNVAGVANLGRQEYTPQTRRSLRFQVLDTVSWQHGPHHVKGGFDFSSVDFSKTAFPYFFGGQYIFVDFPAPIAALFGLPTAISGIQALALGLPGAYIQGYGEPGLNGSVKDLSLFAQDEWSVASNFSINAGVRYQVQFPPGFTYRTTGYSEPYEYPPDYNNIAPRVSFAWDPQGRGRTGVHASYGLFYDNTFSAIPGVPKMIDGIDGVRVYVMQGLPALTGWQMPDRRLPDSALQGQPPLQIAVDPGVITPYAHHFSAGALHELRPGLTVSADFVYVDGRGQIGFIDYNPQVPALGFGRRPEDVNGVPGTSASVLQYTSFAKTRYRGLLLSAEKRFDGRWQAVASYTLAKTNDSSSDYVERPSDNGLGRDPNNPRGLPLGFDPDLDYGASVQDQRHRLVVSGLVKLPALVELSAIFTAASGRPYNILAGFDLNGDGDAGAADRARRNPSDPSTAVGRNSGTPAVLERARPSTHPPVHPAPWRQARRDRRGVQPLQPHELHGHQ